MHGIVKGVLSGDSLVIMGTDASKGPPPEKLITLSGIMAPRLANRNNNTSDQVLLPAMSRLAAFELYVMPRVPSMPAAFCVGRARVSPPHGDWQDGELYFGGVNGLGDRCTAGVW